MLTALIGGEADQQVLAALAHGRLRAKPAELEQALTGTLRKHHRFMLMKHLSHIDFLEEQIGEYDAQIEEYLRTKGPGGSEPPAQGEAVAGAAPDGAGEQGREEQGVAWAKAVELLDTVPGVGRRIAEIILAEIGTDMGRFPSAGHLARWAKVCPGNTKSAGKQLSSKTGRGSPWLRTVLVQAAWAAVKVKDTHLARVYRRLVVRLGAKKAIMAVAHKMLVAIYHMLAEGVAYREYGLQPRSEQSKQKEAERLQGKLKSLGYTVHMTAAPPPTLQPA